jgi:hypothetical protein
MGNYGRTYRIAVRQSPAERAKARAAWLRSLARNRSHQKH